ncbi:energy transducer TonB [Shimia sp.]|uniref:energy transducer TonB n=1 Tax=Shimia sp. TaxID=1954381 RepID=UPI003BA94329
MHIGHYISGIAHTGLIGWVLFGGVLNPDPPPMEVTDVSVISSAEFDALVRSQESPDTVTEVALPTPPEELEPTPELTSQADDTPEQVTPPEALPTEPDVTPELTEVTPPAPIEPDDAAQEAPELPTPVSDSAVIIPDAPVRPAAPQAERVAPEPVAPPEPETAIADTLQEATQPDESAEVQDEVQEETAPEAASTEIATEPKQEELASAAPSRSLRPRVRPTAQPAPAAEAPTAETTDDAIAAALAEASASEATETTAAPSGPPLSQGERDGLRVAVQQCWVVDVGSRAADVTVVVGLSLDRNGKVQGDIKLLSAEGGDDAATRTAFQAARRAVLRCQKDGYDLPVEKYDHWRDVEITFNPDNMRRR